MTNEKLEFRLQENEGVIHGLTQAVVFLARSVKDDPRQRAAAESFIASTETSNITAGLSDYSLQQSQKLLRLLLLQEQP